MLKPLSTSTYVSPKLKMPHNSEFTIVPWDVSARGLVIAILSHQICGLSCFGLSLQFIS